MKLASKDSRRLSRMRRRGQMGIAIALTTASLGAEAAGLGRLNLMSALGQPLRAEIELTSVTRDEAASLNAKLAGPDAFGQANIEYGPALNGLRFSVQRHANGQPYILVTSNQAINEPYLDLLVELNWSSGRLVREYTMLLDPPELRAARRDTGPIVQAQPPASSATARPAPRAAASPPPSANPPDAAAAVARAQRTAPRAAPAGGDYRVQPGDTASSIVRDNKPDGVSLEQMLAVLYRDNPRAFAGNINRLLAGATVRIPDAATAQALDRAEAHRIIVAQSSNFGSYRDRLARDAARVPSTRSAGQQASGKLTTRVEDSAAPSAARDRLELSRAEAGKAGTDVGKSGGSTARGTLNAPAADEMAAKERELQETRARLALLEKNVADLQQLLQLKNQTLADLQKSRGAATPGTGAPSASAPVAPASTAPGAIVPAPSVPAGASPPAAATAPAPQVAPPPPAVVTPAPVPSTVAGSTQAGPAPAPAAEPSVFEQLMNNTLLLAGLAILLVLLIAYGVFTMLRRRKLARFEDSIFVDNSVLRSNSLFGTTGGQSVDTANTGFHSNFVPVAGNLPEQNEVDPVAEADVYIAYGRDAQAEEILKEALRADSSHQGVRLKLLEIYAKRGDSKAFETVASELYAATGGQGEEWKQAAALGATIDSHNPLYRDAPTVEAAPAKGVSSTTAASTGSTARSSLPSGVDFGAAALGGAAAGLAASDLNLRGTAPAVDRKANGPDDLTRTDPMPRIEPSPSPAAAPSMDLDFNLGLTDTGPAPLQAGAARGAHASDAPTPPTRAGGLDFDVGETTRPIADPFTASSFGGPSDPLTRTAVNLPAFRVHADHEPEPARRAEPDSFTASDIFGSSISGDTQALESGPAEASPPVVPPLQAPSALDSQQFEKTEPFDAFSHVNLDLDPAYQATEFRASDVGRTDVWQAMATKLDLAQAYRDIGDTDGARELLEEVVRSGDSMQADRARQLIGELG